jgi:hypothetical protein
MRRTHVLVFSAVVSLLTLLGGGGVLTAQDAAPADYSDHPLVGSWTVDSDPDDPENPVEMATIFPNGTMIDSAADGTNGHGLWEPTSDTSAIVTFYLFFEDGVQLVIRAEVEVAADGQSFTAPYTNEFIEPTGASSGEIGPGMAEGRRLELQAPGTPVASFEEFFGEPAGTPDATPAL